VPTSDAQNDMSPKTNRLGTHSACMRRGCI